jgi:hypothetical protein
MDPINMSEGVMKTTMIRIMNQKIIGKCLTPSNHPSMILPLGGPEENLSNFQMPPIPFLSVLTCSTSSPHDILKVSRKIMDHNPPVGQDKHDG